MIPTPEKKPHNLVIQVVEESDSFFVQFFTFLASLSFVLLTALVICVVWLRPPFLEPISQPIRALFEQLKTQALHPYEPITETSASLPIPQGINSQTVIPANVQPISAPAVMPSFMTADDLLDDSANKIDIEKQPLDTITPSRVLEDPLNKISEDFKIPNSLQRRVNFWFDIYTKYSSLIHVIHHDRYPWIIYRIVDTTPFMSTRGPEWLRRERGNQEAHREQAEIENALQRLSKRSHFSNLNPLEQDLYDRLMRVPGSRRKVLRLAAESVRTQLGQRDFFLNGLRNSARYLPYMEAEFAKRNLPIELTRLPFVESSFNEKAESRVGASGIWQIMPRTGRAYLIVNNNIDERNAPLKATRVAAFIFKTYNHVLKSWPLTVTSYNHGIGNIQIAIRRAGSTDLSTIIERYHERDFKFASSNFYSCFLAALFAEKYQNIVFPTYARPSLQEQDTVVMNQRLRVDQVVRLAGLDDEELLDFNLDLKKAIEHRVFLPKGYELHLPIAAKQKLLANLHVTAGEPKAHQQQPVSQRLEKVTTSRMSGST